MKFIGSIRRSYICHDAKTGFIGKISKYVEGLSEKVGYKPKIEKREFLLSFEFSFLKGRINTARSE
jgi:hypothetical protein